MLGRSVLLRKPSTVPVSSPAPPSAPPVVVERLQTNDVPATMRTFLHEYYSKYSEALYGRPSSTLEWLNTFHQATTHVMNLTSMSGNSFFLSEEAKDSYFLHRECDHKTGQHSALNEMAVGEYCALAFELDYRATSLDRLPDAALQTEHVLSLIRTVSRYYTAERESCKAYVFTCMPKPKFKDKTWTVAQGQHIIFNRNVTVMEGAQISHAATLDLEKRFPEAKGVLDSLYIKSALGYKKTPQLRPAYSSKKVDCYYCNDRTVHRRRLVTSEEEILQQNALFCRTCNNHRFIIDTNEYVFREIRLLDGSVSPEPTPKLSHLLRHSSIWGTLNVQVPVHMPASEPRYSVYDMTQGTVVADRGLKRKKPLTTPLKGHRNPSGEVISIFKVLQNLGLSNVKQRHKSGTAVPLHVELISAIQQLLTSLHSAYEEVGVSRVTAFKNVQALEIRLNGPGSTYCLNKQDYHSSATVQLWLVFNAGYKLLVGCWSDRCGSGLREMPAPEGLILNVFALTRKLVK